MTKEQVEKHGEVIKWFVDNPDKGVWCRRNDTGLQDWVLTKEPNWETTYIFLQNDEYAEFRKALADGKQLQIRDYIGKWVNHYKIPTGNFSYPVNRYRIKSEEPKFKAGDWVYVVYNSGEASLKPYSDDISSDNTIFNIKLWEPKSGGIYVFWDDNNGKRFDYWVIGKLDSICKGKFYLDKNGNKWDNIAPLEYINTLKDKQ